MCGGVVRTRSTRAEAASASRGDTAELAGLAPRNGRTSRTASRHRSLVSFTSRRLTILDENDMETPGPVRTQFDVLLDIRRAGWTGDEVDGPRQHFRLCRDPQAVPAILVRRDHLVPADQHDMGLWQKIERRWGLRSGNQHQSAGLGNCRMTRSDTDPVFRLGPAPAYSQQGPRIPRYLVERRVGSHDEFSGKVLRGEIARDRPGHPCGWA